MELGAIFVGLAMLVASLPFVVKPFEDKRLKKNQKPTTRLNLDKNRQAVLSALRDLDFDFRTGKIGEDDYSMLRPQLLAEAVACTQSNKSVEDDQLEAIIRARKATQSKAQNCSNCGEKFETGSRFCPQCGTEVGNNCPSCSKVVQAGDLFCTVCGTKLELSLESVV
jgi:hypothetical protein